MMNIRIITERIRGAARTLATWLPWRVWATAAALLFAGLWLLEHDARVRERTFLKADRQTSEAQAKVLHAQAESAARDANVQAARARAALDTERRALDRRDAELRARLVAVAERERAEEARAARLSPAEVAQEIEARLGPGAFADARQQQVPAGAQQAIPDSRFQNPEPSGPPATLTLTDSGARQVAAAFMQLDACREESALKGQQVSNCQARVAAEQTLAAAQARSLDELNRALALKDQELARREAAHRAELKSARGTFWSRAWRALTHVAVGVAIGVVAR